MNADRIGEALAHLQSQRIDQIRRAHASAKPKQENTAWRNAHHDLAVLLMTIDEAVKALEGSK